MSCNCQNDISDIRLLSGERRLVAWYIELSRAERLRVLREAAAAPDTSGPLVRMYRALLDI